MGLEEDRTELNNLARECAVLLAEIEAAQKRLQLKLDNIKTRATALWEKIDKALDRRN